MGVSDAGRLRIRPAKLEAQRPSCLQGVAEQGTQQRPLGDACRRWHPGTGNGNRQEDILEWTATAQAGIFSCIVGSATKRPCVPLKFIFKESVQFGFASYRPEFEHTLPYLNRL